MKRRAESWERAGWLSGGAAETWPEAETVGGHGRAGLEMWGQTSAESVWLGGGIRRKGSEPRAVRAASLFSRLRSREAGTPGNHITAPLPLPRKAEVCEGKRRQKRGTDLLLSHPWATEAQH